MAAFSNASQMLLQRRKEKLTKVDQYSVPFFLRIVLITLPASASKVNHRCFGKRKATRCQKIVELPLHHPSSETYMSPVSCTPFRSCEFLLFWNIHVLCDFSCRSADDMLGRQIFMNWSVIVWIWICSLTKFLLLNYMWPCCNCICMWRWFGQ